MREENSYSTERQVLHNVAYKLSNRKIKNIRRVTNLTIGSQKYGIAEKAALVELINYGANKHPLPF